MRALKRHYGAGPLHVLLHVAVFATVLWVATSVVDARGAFNILLWFLAALVVHDLLLLPFYSAIDRVARRGMPGPRVNFVRVPALLSALLLLLFFPPILGRNDDSFSRVAGLEPEGYLERWLLLSAALFAVAALLYVVRRVRRSAATS